MSRMTASARALAGASLVTLAAAAAHSAALEQTVPASIRLLYQEGRYAEFGISYTDPDQSGEGATIPAGVLAPFAIPLEGNTGDVFDDRWNISAAYKADLNDRFSYALIFDEPLWAATSYGAAAFTNSAFGIDEQLYAGSKADVKTYQVSAVLAYDVNPSVKVYGGLRAQRLDAEAAVAFVGDYSVKADDKWGYGWLLGAAYERPEIALRVALTYQSKIGYDLDTRETITPTGAPGPVTQDTETDLDTPQSVQLDFQTGVAPKTLVFGYVRWVDWSEFSVRPPVYEDATAELLGEGRPLIQYADDWWTYNLGLGRQLTDTLAGSFSITWEPSVGGEMTSLGPYDGRTTGTAALTYEVNGFAITGGLTYGVLGDTHNLLETDFNDGTVWGAGLRVGYTF
ncbi:OmpP1/FadL family transporter [Amaricoccus sp.]|uniref:OmpP1/FadL family transporter n=1 Tax=Amaricoccus sp. TaxID=1872485 RepID=UPI0026020E9D|nr:outer membrane protein transport protein [Amaricoccus sp.]HRO11733.1 outer membrane protein transport protein [Amaricoccus sp.]